MPEEKVSIGTILILRDEFERVACDPVKLNATRHRASTMLKLLDEILRFREKEGSEQ